MTSAKTRVLAALKYLVLCIVALVILVPLWDLVVNSLKSDEESRIPTLSLPSHWRGRENYGEAIVRGKVLRGFGNSLLITVSSTVIIVTVSTLAAFVFGRRRSRRIRTVFLLFMMGIITPPSFIMSMMLLRVLGLLGTYWGIILFYSATFCAFPIFLLSGFMSTIPIEIEESAVIDGASSIQVLLRFVLPLLRPAVATSFIWAFLRIWNDFLTPLYLLSGNTRKYTMVLGLYYLKGQWTTRWNLVFANLILVSIPVAIAYLVAQRQIVEGLGAGAVKG